MSKKLAIIVWIHILYLSLYSETKLTGFCHLFGYFKELSHSIQFEQLDRKFFIFAAFCLVAFCALQSIKIISINDRSQEKLGFWMSLLIIILGFRYIFNTDADSFCEKMLVVFLCAASSSRAAIANSFLYQSITVAPKIIIATLTLAAFLGHDSSIHATYHGQIRWSGVWSNPNVYGLLMGVNFIIIVGHVLLCSLAKPQFNYKQARPKHSWTGPCKQLVNIILISAAVLVAMGILSSYSRGAWLATCIAVGYLLQQRISCNTNWNLIVGISKSKAICLCRNIWFSIIICLLSIIVILFMHCQQAGCPSMQRVCSSLNTLDFSWRNRVAAWEGALQIAMEHPIFGAGWNQNEELYQHYYLSPKLTESAAIQMNDYLMLGATLGIPALFCFGMYLWLTLTRKHENGNLKPEMMEADWLQTTCRAGAIVLLFGFWFDGGLFKLPTAATFWILLELGSVQSRMDTNKHQ